MANVYFTSDWHLGHRNIIKHRPGYQSEEEHANFILETYKETVNERDVVWFLGDICFRDEYVEEIRNLPGDKRLVLGNHDLEYGKNRQSYLNIFDRVHGIVKYKGFWLTHCPIHPVELRGKYNVHGHTHEINIDDDRFFNVSIDQGSVLVNLDYVRRYFNVRF